MRNQSRIGALAAFAATLGVLAPESTAEIFRASRGKTPKGHKWKYGVYIPAGERRNVDLTAVKNPKVAAQINAMHDKWLSAKMARESAKQTNQ